MDDVDNRNNFEKARADCQEYYEEQSDSNLHPTRWDESFGEN